MQYETKNAFRSRTTPKYETKSAYRGKYHYNTGGVLEGLGYVAANIGIGAAGIVEGVTDLFSAGALAITGNTEAAKNQFLDSWSGEWKRSLDEWYNPSAAMSFLGDVGAGVGNSLVAAIPYAGLPAFFMGAAGGGISSAAEKTGDVGFKEVGYGLTSGIVEGMLEKYVGPGSAKIKGIGTKALSSLTKNTAKSGIRNSVWKSVLSNMGEEFLEESIAEVIDPWLQRTYQIDPQASTSFPAVLRAGIIGGISGGILGGAQIGATAIYDKNVGKTIAANGNTAAIKRTAESVLSSPFFIEQNKIKDEGLQELAGTLNSFNALTPEKLQSGEGYRLLGAMKRQLFGIEVRSKSAPYRAELLQNAEKTAQYATKFYGRNYTAEDIKADKDGILTNLTVIKWAGDAEIKEIAKKRAQAAYEASRKTAQGTAPSAAVQEATASPASATSPISQEAPSVPKNVTPTTQSTPTVTQSATPAQQSEPTVQQNAPTIPQNAPIVPQNAPTIPQNPSVLQNVTPAATVQNIPNAANVTANAGLSSEGSNSQTITNLGVADAKRMTTERLNSEYDRLTEHRNEIVREYTAEKSEERRKELRREEKHTLAAMSVIKAALKERNAFTRYNLEENAGETRYSIKYPTFSESEISENMETLANMEAVATVDKSKLEKTGKRPKDIFNEYFDSLGNSIYSDTFGDIALSNSSAKSEIRHGITAEKIASLEAIPAVIENGKVIFHKHKEAGVERIVVAAPIQIGETEYYMGVMLQRDARYQTLYLHNVANIEIKREETSNSKDNLVTTGALENENNLSITSILQKAINVKLEKQKSQKNSSEENRLSASNTTVEAASDTADKAEDIEEEAAPELDDRTKKMMGSYPEDVIDRARKYVRGFDMLSFERKVAVCELIDTSPNMGARELRAMCVLVSERDGLFAYSAPTKHKGVYKVLNRLEGLRLIVLSSETDGEGDEKRNPVGETIFHEIAHDIRAASPKVFHELAVTAMKHVGKKESADITDRYTKHFAGESFSEWKAKQENKDVTYEDFFKAHGSNENISPEIITEEIVAGYVGKALGNSRYLKYLGDRHPKTFKSVCRTLNSLLHCLFGKNRYAERALLEVYIDFYNALKLTQVGDLFEKSTPEYSRYMEDEEEVPVIEIQDNEELNELIKNSDKSKYDVIRQYLIEKFKGYIFTMSDGRKAIMDNSDAKELAHKANKARTAQLGSLEDIISKAHYDHSEYNVEHNKFKDFHYYSIIAKYGAGEYPLWINIGSAKNDNVDHIYAITNKKEDAPTKKGVGSPVGNYLQNASSNKSIPENGENVNRNSKNTLEEERYSLSDERDITPTERIQKELKDRGVDAKRAKRIADQIINDGWLKNWGTKTTRHNLKIKILELIKKYASAEIAQVRLKRSADGSTMQVGDRHHSLKLKKEFEAGLTVLAEQLPKNHCSKSKLEAITAAKELIRSTTLFVPEELSDVIKGKKGLKISKSKDGAVMPEELYETLAEKFPEIVPPSSDTKEILENILDILKLDESKIGTPYSDEVIAHHKEQFKISVRAAAESLSTQNERLSNDEWKETYLTGKHMLSIVSTLNKLKNILNNGSRPGFKEADEFVRMLISKVMKPSGDIPGNKSWYDLNESALRDNIVFTNQTIRELIDHYKSADNINDTEFDGESEDGKRIIETYIPKETLEELEEIARNKDKTLTSDDYALLDRFLTGLLQWYKTYDMVFYEGKYVARQEMIDEYVSSGSYELLNMIGKEKAGKIGAFKSIVKSLAMGFLDTRSVMAFFDGYKQGGLFTRLFDDLERSAAEMAILRSNMLSKRDQFFEKHKKFELRLKLEKIKYQGGEITLGEALSLYETSKREQAFYALYGSDITFMSQGNKHYKGRGFNEKVSPEVMREEIRTRMLEIEDQINGDEAIKEYLKIIEEFFNETSKDVKYNADIAYFGYSNVENGFYYPISRDKSAFAPDMLSTRAQFSEFISVASLPFNKATIKNAKAALVIADINDVVNRHAAGLAQYACMYNPVNTINRLLGKRIDIKKEVREGRAVFYTHGGTSSEPQSLMRIITDNVFDGNQAKAQAYWVQLLNNAQGLSTKKRDALQRMLDFIAKNATINALGLNIKSLMTQLAAIPLCSYSVDHPCLMKGLISFANKAKSREGRALMGELMDKYSIQAKSRNIDSSAVRTNALMDRVAPTASRVMNFINGVGEFSMSGISATDRASFLIVWEAAQYQAQKNTGYAIGTEENMKAAGAIVDDFAVQTQPTITAANSAAARSENFFARTIMRFTSANTKMFSRMVDSLMRIYVFNKAEKEGIGNVSKKDIETAKKQGKRMCASIIISQLVMVALVRLFKFAFAKEPDEGETVIEDIGGDILDAYVGIVPVVSQIHGFFNDGYEISDFTFDTLNDTLGGIKETFKLTAKVATGKQVSATEVAKSARRNIYSLGALFGVPVRNTWNNLTGLVKRVSPSAGATVNSLFYDPAASDISKALNNGNTRLAETVTDLMLSQRGGELDRAAAKAFLELYNARDEDGEVNAYGIMPRAVPKEISVDGKEYTLSAKQTKDFEKVYNGASKALTRLVGKSEYSKLDEAARAKAIKAVYSLYYSKATTAALGTPKSKGEIISENLSDTEGYVLTVAYASTVTGDGRKNKILEYMKGLGLGSSDQTWILASLGYSDAKKAVAEQLKKKGATAAEISKLGLSAA